VLLLFWSSAEADKLILLGPPASIYVLNINDAAASKAVALWLRLAVCDFNCFDYAWIKASRG